MAVKHPENFVSVRQGIRSSVVVDSQLERLYQTIDAVDNTESTASLMAQATLLEIMQHLAHGDDFFYCRQFEQAIAEYKTAHALIYQLMDPTFQISDIQVWRFPVKLPLSPELFTSMLAACSELIEAMMPRAIKGRFAPAFTDVPPQPSEEILAYEELGLRVVDGIPKSVLRDSEFGETYALRGQWKRAEFFYRRAKQALGTPNTPETQAALAALNLSLGGVLVQMGQTAEAQRLSTDSAKYFQSIGESVGHAQAQFNIAAALVREEKHDQAKSSLDIAKQLLNRGRRLSQLQRSSNQNVGGVLSHENLGNNLLGLRTNFLSSAMSPEALEQLIDAKDSQVVYRQPGVGGVVSEQQVKTKEEVARQSYIKKLVFRAGTRTVTVQWPNGDRFPIDTMKTEIYAKRVAYKSLIELAAEVASYYQSALSLPHLYFYVIPVCLGDCYHELGEFATAEDFYLKAADYQYINTALELPDLWRKLTENILEWGDGQYKENELNGALTTYRKVMEPPGANSVVWAESPLYRHQKLKIVGDSVSVMLEHYSTKGISELNPLIAAAVLSIRGRLRQINAGLDFFGMPADPVPIWCFDYLQSVARYFAQQAIRAERDFINFWDRAENEQLTRQQLQQAVDLAAGEKEMAARQREAAEKERAVYEGLPIYEVRSDGKVLDGCIFQAPSAKFDQCGMGGPAIVGVMETIQIGSDTDGTNPIYRIKSIDSPTQLTLKTQPPLGTNLNWSLHRTLATVRRSNAQADYDRYNNMSDERAYIDSQMAWYNAPGWATSTHIGQWQQVTMDNPFGGEPLYSGDVWNPEGGPYTAQYMSDLSMRRSSVVKEYELGKISEQINQLSIAEDEALQQLDVADARLGVARQMEVVAELRAQHTQENLSAFDSQLFTPETWFRLGGMMRVISARYTEKAIGIAKLMEKAYNYENDIAFSNVIKNNYGLSAGIGGGMLAGDLLLLDIDSFTYDLVTRTKGKQMPVKQTISLAERYPYRFETQFRRTGRMDFDTALDDLDLVYPGAYGHRIVSVEVEVEGLLPREGLHGTLTNCGISRYRSPYLHSAIKYRIQPKETLMLSEHRVKQDALIFPITTGALKVFEGTGVAGSWTLEFPSATNNVDYASITDVRLIVYYKAGYDPALAEAVRAELSTRPGLYARSRNFLLRWTFPDAFFHFQDTGCLKFSLGVSDFPTNQLNPRIRALALVVAAESGTTPANWNLRLGVPGHPDTLAAHTDAAGVIEVNPQHPWKVLTQGSALGDYLLEIRAEENPDLVEGGVLKLNKIRDLGLVLQYDYTPRS